MIPKSTHRVEVVGIRLEPHPNADSLSIAHVWGYVCVVRTDEWRDGDLAAYIVPDSVVPDRPEYAFLKGSFRIRTRRFRGIMSQGLLMPAPPGSKEGDDVAEQMGVIRYEPPETFFMGGDCVTPPVGFYPAYDVEDWHRYGHLLKLGEPVYITEKIHGTSSRYLVDKETGEFFAGSRGVWKKKHPECLYWKIADQNPWIETYCRANPGSCLYGEIYGWVQSLRYGARRGEARFRAFDVMLPFGEWIDAHLFHATWELAGVGCATVPILFTGDYDAEVAKRLSMGPSSLGDNEREGVVIRPWLERTDPSVGRIQFKIVSDEYLAKGQ